MFDGEIMIYNYLEKQTNQLEELLHALLNQYEDLQFIIKEKSAFIRVLEEGTDQQADSFSPYDLNQLTYQKLGEVKEELEHYREEASAIKLEIQTTESKIKEYKCICDEVKALEEERISNNADSLILSDSGKNSVLENYGLDEFDYAGFRLRILETQEQERKRIARDLHDSPVQNLTAMVHKVDFCTRLIDEDPIRSKIEMLNIAKNLKSTINEMRRIIYDLRPMALDDIGLAIALERELGRIERQNNVKIEFSYSGPIEQIDSTISSTLFRIIQEACYNAVKHGEANLIQVQLDVLNSNVKVTIRDDGLGFDMNESKKVVRNDNHGFGLTTMKERIFLLSGKLTITSSVGNGTSIIVNIPMKVEEI